MPCFMTYSMKVRIVKPSLWAMACTLSTSSSEQIKEKCRQGVAGGALLLLVSSLTIWVDGSVGIDVGSSLLACGGIAALPKILPSRMSMFFFAIATTDNVIQFPPSAQNSPWLHWRLGHTQRCSFRCLPTLQGRYSHGCESSW